MSSVEFSQQVVSLPPLESPLPGALPPDRRAALELRKAQLRAAPPSESASRSDQTVTLSPVSTEAGEGHGVHDRGFAALARPIHEPSTH